MLKTGEPILPGSIEPNNRLFRGSRTRESFTKGNPLNGAAMKGFALLAVAFASGVSPIEKTIQLLEDLEAKATWRRNLIKLLELVVSSEVIGSRLLDSSMSQH